MATTTMPGAHHARKVAQIRYQLGLQPFSRGRRMSGLGALGETAAEATAAQKIYAAAVAQWGAAISANPAGVTYAQEQAIENAAVAQIKAAVKSDLKYQSGMVYNTQYQLRTMWHGTQAYKNIQAGTPADGNQAMVNTSLVPQAGAVQTSAIPVTSMVAASPSAFLSGLSTTDLAVGAGVGLLLLWFLFKKK